MRRKGKRQEKVGQAAAPSEQAYEVFLSEQAERIYRKLYFKCKEAEARGDLTSISCTTFRMVQEAIKTIIPRDPLNRQYGLHGELANIFRLRKGRLRICWLASSQTRRVCILFISETLRKEGDTSDPYRLFTKMVVGGEFDAWFERLGVRKPS